MLERLDALRDGGGGGDLGVVEENCADWARWYPGSRWKQDDAGL